ncbi:hypothetical protein STAFG_5535 [Streptomyces afghaniensis 772]|uniref:Uncharacterized protein n=1 Tax=Streptomyces afghaniensis 772 TaxID=1283301 RepID=S4MLD0_9ACTN|nr:hypothetical protein STAFG_5535 [Streptomyces afghaniensis 772]
MVHHRRTGLRGQVPGHPQRLVGVAHRHHWRGRATRRRTSGLQVRQRGRVAPVHRVRRLGRGRHRPLQGVLPARLVSGDLRLHALRQRQLGPDVHPVHPGHRRVLRGARPLRGRAALRRRRRGQRQRPAPHRHRRGTGPGVRPRPGPRAARRRPARGRRAGRLEPGRRPVRLRRQPAAEERRVRRPLQPRRRRALRPRPGPHRQVRQEVRLRRRTRKPAPDLRDGLRALRRRPGPRHPLHQGGRLPRHGRRPGRRGQQRRPAELGHPHLRGHEDPGRGRAHGSGRCHGGGRRQVRHRGLAAVGVGRVVHGPAGDRSRRALRDDRDRPRHAAVHRPWRPPGQALLLHGHGHQLPGHQRPFRLGGGGPRAARPLGDAGRRRRADPRLGRVRRRAVRAGGVRHRRHPPPGVLAAARRRHDHRADRVSAQLPVLQDRRHDTSGPGRGRRARRHADPGPAAAHLERRVVRTGQGGSRRQGHRQHTRAAVPAADDHDERRLPDLVPRHPARVGDSASGPVRRGRGRRLPAAHAVLGPRDPPGRPLHRSHLPGRHPLDRGRLHRRRPRQHGVRRSHPHLLPRRRRGLRRDRHRRLRQRQRRLPDRRRGLVRAPPGHRRRRPAGSRGRRRGRARLDRPGPLRPLQGAARHHGRRPLRDDRHRHRRGRLRHPRPVRRRHRHTRHDVPLRRRQDQLRRTRPPVGVRHVDDADTVQAATHFRHHGVRQQGRALQAPPARVSRTHTVRRGRAARRPARRQAHRPDLRNTHADGRVQGHHQRGQRRRRRRRHPHPHGGHPAAGALDLRRPRGRSPRRPRLRHPRRGRRPHPRQHRPRGRDLRGARRRNRPHRQQPGHDRPVRTTARHR